jgi:hypothetical protein
VSSNSEQIVQQIRQDFQDLMEYVMGDGSQTRTAYEVELTLFRRLLALGKALLRLFFVRRAAVRPIEPVYAPDGTELKYQSLRPTTYFSVFGKVRFHRHYYHTPGQVGSCPLDAALSLPARCYSDLLRDWTEYGSTNESYNENLQTVERILGLTLAKQALETGVREDAIDVDAFYDQKAVPLPRAEGPILVLQADGKGVPMVRGAPTAPPARRGKGEKRTQKKEAVVTAIYTIAPHVRTPQAVAAALMADPVAGPPPRALAAASPQRPEPVGKEVRATLAGKNAALDRLARRVAQRDGPHIHYRVALTDGAEALQRQMLRRWPLFTLVLDIIHVIEYLWLAANAWLGETHPYRTAWVHEQLVHLLAGRTALVIQTLEKLAQQPTLSPAQRQALHTTIGYYRRNRPYMRYDLYLARGWPIGSGVVEGACGHLVKDRMERSAMRWTVPGAQALLELRAVRINEDWAAYQHFHRQCQHQRLYDGAYAMTIPVAEAFALHLVEQVAA